MGFIIKMCFVWCVCVSACSCVCDHVGVYRCTCAMCLCGGQRTSSGPHLPPCFGAGSLVIHHCIHQASCLCAPSHHRRAGVAGVNAAANLI